ncbi:hypothetical protein [Reyranella soli]|uniref:Uncharacterized protein n=1 Tax=Reyranella soli TaxID=1230389 RepID=A0A512NAS3_9HYPH|nr:hypothetical protein [Reyranella soli]GEP56041.1 hypothetical protein RSO01_32070 [Reyranella soli]
MTRIDVIPIGGRQFLIQLFRVATIPDHIGFGRYYEATCAIELAEGSTILQECVAHRPKNRRNITGDRHTDWLILLVKTDLTQTQLSGATISVAQYGAELTNQEIATIGLLLSTTTAGG